MDYRLKPNRRAYFDTLYAATLRHSVMPGCVYCYFPALAERLGWDDDQKLWFAFLNGLTQNPITSLAMMEEWPLENLGHGYFMDDARDWFNENWARLQFDVDRQKNKRLTLDAVDSYHKMYREAGGQVPLLTGSFPELWERLGRVASFGRLSTFSYLEFCWIYGHGAECDDLMFGDLHGSRSHRNGMLLLLGRDDLVLDKRAGNGVTGYKDLPGIARNLAEYADAYLHDFKLDHPDVPNVGYFTLESQACQFKNSFYSRRYMGVYADMAMERIEWAEAAWGSRRHTQVFRDIREECLPAWLRVEAAPDGLTIKQRAAVFPATGVPYRAEHFL
jgi:hypothetical protein